MRTAAKIDKNQPAIVERLKSMGASVQTLAQVGKGTPDLLIGFDGLNILIEVKEVKGKLTADQTSWHRDWKGQVDIARSAFEASQIVNNYSMSILFKMATKLLKVLIELYYNRF